MFQQALRMTLRDWRTGELRFLLIALIVAVAALSSVGFFVDRMRAGMTRDAHQLLGADLLVAADQPLSPQWLQQAGPQWHAVGEGIRDFADTAAALSCMDLVISVDTAAAHLAGALGLPVWIALPYSPDWRWFLQRHDSPWYPTARLFRQQRAGDWDEVITTLRAALAVASFSS